MYLLQIFLQPSSLTYLPNCRGSWVLWKEKSFTLPPSTCSRHRSWVRSPMLLIVYSPRLFNELGWVGDDDGGGRWQGNHGRWWPPLAFPHNKLGVEQKMLEGILGNVSFSWIWSVSDDDRKERQTSQAHFGVVNLWVLLCFFPCCPTAASWRNKLFKVGQVNWKNKL